MEETQEGILPPKETPPQWKSNDIGKLAQALAKVQAEMKGAIKGSNNPFFNSGGEETVTPIRNLYPHDGGAMIDRCDRYQHVTKSVVELAQRVAPSWVDKEPLAIDNLLLRFCLAKSALRLREEVLQLITGTLVAHFATLVPRPSRPGVAWG